MMKREVVYLAVPFLTCVLSFQNCSQTSFLATPPSASADASSASATSSPSSDPSAITSGNLKSFRPVLAVGGVNCMGCHGVVSGNIVTDFGLSSGNFVTSSAFFGNNGRTAFNDVDSSGVGGWSSLTVNNGSILIPKMMLPASAAQAMSGVAQPISLAAMMKLSEGSPAHSMVDLVTPPAGMADVQEYSQVAIGYPSQSEILNLLPASLANVPIAVAAVNVAGLSTSSFSGFGLDGSGAFIRNTSSVVQCMGDVVVKGPLFLKNVTIQSDAGGCRLYVSQSVFIQGPINYAGSAGANLQVTSARAILMGMSAVRMGYAGGGASAVRTDYNTLTTAGGPWARFLPSNDVAYSPVSATVNGIARSSFFDSLVLDAVAIGSELLDAGDPAAVSSLVPGESISTEVGTDENAGVGGSRVSINYNHLLLNAPHVHSRYAGTFQGTIIADIAMLARNPSSGSFEQFTFDPLFASAPRILPALSTNILTLQQ